MRGIHALRRVGLQLFYRVGEIIQFSCQLTNFVGFVRDHGLSIRIIIRPRFTRLVGCLSRSSPARPRGRTHSPCGRRPAPPHVSRGAASTAILHLWARVVVTPADAPNRPRGVEPFEATAMIRAVPTTAPPQPP